MKVFFKKLIVRCNKKSKQKKLVQLTADNKRLEMLQKYFLTCHKLTALNIYTYCKHFKYL